jgi:two-component system sensor histidine kinase UhpB
MVDAHANYSRLAEVASGLGLHEHLCVIYDTREEQFAVSSPFLATGLERGEKCILFADENTAGAVLDALRKRGTDVDPYLRSGALTITHKRDTDLQQGRFDPDWWMGFLNQASAEAAASGLSALRILGDLSWALQGDTSTDSFLEYESSLNRFVRGHNARIICQYRRHPNPPQFILGIIRAHPVVVYGGLVSKNPYYVPPEEFLKPNQAALEVERLLNNILAWERAEEALQTSEERLRLISDTVPALILTARPDGYLDFVNQRWLDYAGLSSEDLVGWKWTAVIHPEDVGALVEKWRNAIATGQPFESQSRLRRADGEYHWMIHRKVPLRDERGNIVKWYGSSIDIEDRKRAENELRKQKEVLQKIFDNAPVMIAFLGPDGELSLINRELERTLGWTLQEMRAHDHDDLLAEFYPEPKYRQQAIEFMSSPNPEFADLRVRVRDGRAIDTSWSKVKLSDGTEIYIGRDITKRKRAEEELRQTEERIRAILEYSPNWIFLKDTEGRYLLVNREIERVFGISQEQIKGKTDGEIFPPEQAAEYRANDLKVLRAGRTMEFEERALLEDGPHTSIVHKFPLFDTHGNIYATGGVATDITEHKRAEEALRKSEARWRSVFENSAIGVALTDLNGRFLAANPVYQKMVGYSEEELRGLSFLDITQEGFRISNWTLIGELLDGKREQFQIEKQYRRKDSRLIWVRNNVSLVPGTESVPRFIMALSEDITESKRAEEALQKSRDQLRALAARVQTVREEERARVAREIHDELGQALTAIKIDLSSLIRGQPAAKKQESASVLKLVDETIQSVRRISTELRPAILDAGGLAAALEWAAGEFEARTGTKCRLDLPQADVAIDQDRATALFRIFQETLTNVARHANATEVNVRLAEENGDLTLEVHDNGQGLSEEQLSGGGSLGILGMRERALLLGGELKIKGSPEKGTTVRVRVPPARRPEKE